MLKIVVSSTSTFMSLLPLLCGTLSYLIVAVHRSSNLPAALRSCCRDAVTEGLVAMVAGRVLERSLRGGVELQGTLGKQSRSYQLRQEKCTVGWEWWMGGGVQLSLCVRAESERLGVRKRGGVKGRDWEAKSEMGKRESSNLEQIVQQYSTLSWRRHT